MNLTPRPLSLDSANKAEKREPDDAGGAGFGWGMRCGAETGGEHKQVTRATRYLLPHHPITQSPLEILFYENAQGLSVGQRHGGFQGDFGGLQPALGQGIGE